MYFLLFNWDRFAVSRRRI